MPLLKAALAFAFLATSLLHAQTKVVGFLCYPSDEMIKESCDAFEKQMKDCGVTVKRLDDFTGDLSNPKEKKRAAEILSLSGTTPIFISSHGASFAGKHYIGSAVGNIDTVTLGPHDHWEAPDAFKSDTEESESSLVFLTEPILVALGGRPTLLSACFSGGACETGKPKKNLITSCGVDETSKQLDMPGGHYQEPVLYWAGQLYCDPKTFEEADTTAPKEELSEVEISYFLAKKMGGKKTVPFVFSPREMSLDPKDLKQLVQFVSKPRKTTEIRVIDESRLKSETEAKARALTEGKPDLKGSAVNVGTLKEISWKEDGKTKTRLLPGYYMAQVTAEAAARKWLGSKDIPFKMKDAGSVYEVVVEDRSQPCRLTRSGIPQSPQVGGTIKSLTH